MQPSIDRTTPRAGMVRGHRPLLGTFLGAGLALVLVAGTAGASVPFPEAGPERRALHGSGVELAGRGKVKEDKRGSSAQMQGGSSADRYGGSSADREGVGGQRDRRVYSKPKRPPKEREPEKPVDAEQQEERVERDALEPREPRNPR